eukprot:NODE_2382_length_708_cov_644.763278_g1934_i0.p2 GENE.NODE_2382_length_708_cov_644.763278_g1934_i0~~NODE_2382_length_708_cov_644.763278_g1934_i0.p2  ORF type:complete len:181 (+),score=47.48 NODE_2382_length_708_cov_644.763278_g1934_i0:96-638(+)
MPGKSINIRHYVVVGRKVPDEKDPNPTVFKATIFAQNHVVAKQRFWSLMRKQNKVKKAGGQLLQVRQVREKNIKTIKNYSILLRFTTKTGVMNVTKEFRDVSLCGAVHQMYMNMGSLHRATYASIDIIGTTILKAKEVSRPNVKQFLKHHVKFPLMQHRTKITKKFRNTPFRATRPANFR